jgi:cyclomaltodextrinase
MFPDRPDGLAPWGWPIHHLHRQLIEMRSRHPWMTRSQVTVAHVTNTSLALQVAPPGGQGRRITALLNIADEHQAFPVELPDPTIEVQSDAAADEQDLLVVPGHAWRVLSHSAPHWA